MEASLPTYAVFYSESAGKYLSYMSDDGGELNRTVAAKAKNAWNPRSKFEVVPSKLHPAMIHLRCSFHNKFLRRRSEAESWIVAAAVEQDDDLSQWFSTLFLPEFDQSTAQTTTARLLHVESSRYLQWYDGGGGDDPYSMCVRATSTDPSDPKSSFRVINWDDLVILPKHSSFLHMRDVKYLGIRTSSAQLGALQFIEYDRKEKSLENEVVYLPDGSVYIRNVSRDAFWRVDASTSSNLVLADADDPPATAATNPEIHFRPIKVDNSQLALLHLGTGKFCARDSVEIEDGLRAASDDTSDDSTHLMFGDALSSSRIDDIKLDLEAAWLEFRNDVTLNKGVAVSNETGKSLTRKVEIPYTDIWNGEWKDTVFTFPVGITTEISPEEVPWIEDSSVIKTRPPPPSPPDYYWRHIRGVITDKVVVHEVKVPAMTTVTAKLLAELAVCEVPFSYTRRDFPASGGEEIYYMEDGRYTGNNYFNLRVEVSPPQPIMVAGGEVLG